jgi:biotin transport system substrate-specific component
MAVSMTTQNTVLGVLIPKQGAVHLAANLATVVIGSILLTISAKISVPVWPVPVTLQTFAVAALAAAFGWRVGVATVALYIAEGLAGLPVFASGGGAAYVFSPTFGFIVGYLPMAFVIGLAADRGASGKALPLFIAMLAGDAIVFVLGYVWLLAMGTGAAWLDQANLVGSAFEKAVQPFILWDILKMAFAALTVAGVWTLVRRKPTA